MVKIKMNNVTWILILGLLFSYSCKEKKEKTMAVATEDNGIPLTVDTDASIIYWTGFGPKTMHHGTLKLKEGILYIAGDKIKLGGFTINMNTIKCTSITNEKDRLKLERHLNRSDFFDIIRFPDAQFTLTQCEVVANNDSVTHHIGGHLELKGLDKGLSFDAKITKDGDVYKAVSRPFKIDRTQWGINYGSNTIYDEMQSSIVNDSIEIKVEMIARAKNPK